MPATSAFFAAVRPLFGGSLSQKQVDGINAILAAWERFGDGDDRHLAYILATVKHETAHTMQPIREFGRGKGKAYGKPDETGKAPYGRGLVQLTWRYNYVKADMELGLRGRLAENYDLALDPEISVRILIAGMLEGWFTGKKLADYSEFKSMRRVVNGTDKASLIAGHADTFLAAIQAAKAAAEPANPANPANGWVGILINLIKALFEWIKGLRK
jgi:predicted chitinase